ncbi:hypothetical protein [Lutibacter sp.]|uniref:hypothetical protein n=1 Tax=Lutibacter sp. TaxID=1925666 RepID=UPI002735C470|nr:hypothetical protein [Lutibacter sp.]MDP3313211.1 hypothetical protein [Lutibacter sp.]
MKKNKIEISVFFIVLNFSFVFSQEWKNLKTYQNETNKIILDQGCWLKKDRINNSTIWNRANQFNLSQENGFLKYSTVSQIRDFYVWFDNERLKQGHDIKWIGIAAIAIDQFSKLENRFIQIFIVRNKELILFGQKGSLSVFEATFPFLRNVYFSPSKITGIEAVRWDEAQGTNEQCVVLDPLYNNLSDKAFYKLERMANRKGIYCLGVPKKFKFEGDLKDCQTRIDFGLNKLLPIYLNSK